MAKEKSSGPTAMSPQELQRRQLGKDKKLWGIEVLFFDEKNNAVKRHFINNQTSAELVQFRDNIFQIGIMVPYDAPGRFRVFSPVDIKEINVWRQENFFEP